MDTWFNQPAYPIVTIDRDYDTGEIKATQKKVQLLKNNDTEGNDAWWIPLNYITQSNLNSSSTLATHWLKPQDESVTIEKVDINDWIIVNKQLAGYYRVNYDVTNWKRIAVFLNSDDYDKIPILNRAQIIDDVYFMMKNEELDFNIFLEVINYLWREIDPVPWFPAFQIIQLYTTTYLQVPEVASIFKPYFFNLTYKLFKHIDFDHHPDDDPVTIETRLDFTKVACSLNIHPECREKATTKLLAYVEDPIANKISSKEEFLFCFGLMQANESIWNQFLQRRNETLTDYFKFLGCSENLNIIEKHLNFLEENYNYFFSNMLTNPLNVDIAIDIFIKKFDQINAHQHDRVIKDIIMKSIEENHIKKIKDFAEQRGLDISKHLVSKNEKLIKINAFLLKIRNALENNQFSVVMNIALSNDTSQANKTDV